ncbi:MAG: hypothetical protein MHM6MM_002447 [Cercozoa sp. M6MM]
MSGFAPVEAAWKSVVAEIPKYCLDLNVWWFDTHLLSDDPVSMYETDRELKQVTPTAAVRKFVRTRVLASFVALAEQEAESGLNDLATHLCTLRNKKTQVRETLAVWIRKLIWWGRFEDRFDDQLDHAVSVLLATDEMLRETDAFPDSVRTSLLFLLVRELVVLPEVASGTVRGIARAWRKVVDTGRCDSVTAVARLGLELEDPFSLFTSVMPLLPQCGNIYQSNCIGPMMHVLFDLIGAVLRHPLYGAKWRVHPKAYQFACDTLCANLSLFRHWLHERTFAQVIAPLKDSKQYSSDCDVNGRVMNRICSRPNGDMIMYLWNHVLLQHTPLVLFNRSFCGRRVGLVCGETAGVVRDETHSIQTVLRQLVIATRELRLLNEATLALPRLPNGTPVFHYPAGEPAPENQRATETVLRDASIILKTAISRCTEVGTHANIVANFFDAFFVSLFTMRDPQDVMSHPDMWQDGVHLEWDVQRCQHASYADDNVQSVMSELLLPVTVPKSSQVYAIGAKSRDTLHKRFAQRILQYLISADAPNGVVDIAPMIALFCGLDAHDLLKHAARTLTI